MEFNFKKTNIEVIPHSEQRYDTWGDYWIDENGVLQIRVSEFENPDFALYTAIHELLEVWRVIKKGIPLEAIDRFDLAHIDHPDPGCLPEAPYHEEHLQSMDVEQLIAAQDGYDFKKYYNTSPKGASE